MMPLPRGWPKVTTAQQALEVAMNETNEATAPHGSEHAVRKGWERILLGENSIAGTFRMIGYILAFVVVFGALFYFAG